ncbi:MULTISPECIES: putative quinol monooxygenase [Aliiglaciecola]|uniref:putative quinol monooxygenase n=1 Tax=Aliiglaciecola TaxID=1406885 RepID=UPI0026E44084|nr:MULTISPECIES: putative quinol monooxygenase [unclassified Aliiglaciecola]MDO6710393.1 putative quinol monooxygenase [Aliiglaciecola sp. 2_MG-2023]MDO6751742.1 putative quinol monooxygenase [Aliiglaciecola sp. 1_MG-2023]
MHCIFATITPKPQYFKYAKKAILGILGATRKEEGCLQFDVHTNQSETQLFLYEQWQDESALEQHYQQDYTKQVFTAYQDWLAEPVEIKTMALLK